MNRDEFVAPLDRINPVEGVMKEVAQQVANVVEEERVS
jgi:hypothetical protein